MEQRKLIKDELFKNIEKFMNEIDLTMDYLDKNTVSSITKYMNKLVKNEILFNEFVEYTALHLKTFEAQISSVLFSNKKIKRDYYNFLNGVTLFNNILKFRVFENESKNTKKDLIKYLYSIYMSCVFLNGELTSESFLNDKLKEFVLTIENEAKTALNENDIKKPKERVVPQPTVTHPTSIPSFTGMGDMGNIMESILGNKEILNIASDISQKMQNQQMNPMDMLSALMSGNIENSPLQGLVAEIQEKVDMKINNGEIDKENLENQAKDIMGSISSNPNALGSMGGMSEMIQNMVSELQKK